MFSLVLDKGHTYMTVRLVDQVHLSGNLDASRASTTESDGPKYINCTLS